MVPREKKHSLKVYCLNVPEEADAYALLLNNPRIVLGHMTENWDNFGNFRIVVHVEEDIDPRPVPKEQSDDDDDFDNIGKDKEE